MASIPEFIILGFLLSLLRFLEGKEISVLIDSELGLECVQVAEIHKNTRGGGLLLLKDAPLLLCEYSLSPTLSLF